jgi:hypothetical protein
MYSLDAVSFNCNHIERCFRYAFHYIQFHAKSPGSSRSWLTYKTIVCIRLLTYAVAGVTELTQRQFQLLTVC